MTTMNRAVSIGVFVMAAFNGLFLFGNGLFMLIAPRSGISLSLASSRLASITNTSSAISELSRCSSA
jgi:hypothetical protein